MILLAQPSYQAGIFQCKNPMGDIGSTFVLDCVEYHCIRRSGFSTEWVEKGLVENCEQMLQSNDNDASDQRSFGSAVSNGFHNAVNGIENVFGSVEHGIGNAIGSVQHGIGNAFGSFQHGIENGLNAAGSGLSALVHQACNICNYGRSIGSILSDAQQQACKICYSSGGGAKPAGQDSSSYQTMKFLAKPALSLLSHEACPEHPFTCHGFVFGGKCHGICGQGHPNMTTGQAMIISATHAYQYNCKQQCPDDLTSPTCNQCIVSAMGLQTSGQRNFLDDLGHAVSGAIHGITCAVGLAPTIAECVSSFEGNIAGIVQCSKTVSGSKDCICKTLCSAYPPACSKC